MIFIRFWESESVGGSWKTEVGSRKCDGRYKYQVYRMKRGLSSVFGVEPSPNGIFIR